LYYAELPEGVLFGSEIKALIRHPGLPRELDLPALHYHLAYIWTPAPRTLLRAVRKLPPGECMLLRGARVERQWRYWEVPFGREPLAGSEAEVVERVRTEVEGAVRRQLMADVPVGAFLSGGLDSSAIVAMMKRALPDARPVCYTIHFGGGGRIEGNVLDLPYAQLAADALDVELRVVDVRPNVVHELERLVWALDEPQADLAPMNALLIAEAARADGIPVLLSGTGGDDLFAGYRRHRALHLERFWSWLPAPARRGLGRSARAAADGRGGAMSTTWVRRAVKAFVAADRSPDERLAAYLWWNEDGLRRSLYSPELAAATAGEATASPLVNTLAQLPAGTDRLDRMLWLELQHFLGDHNLNYTDKTGMAASVEVRVPLLDLELVELASRIPAGLKQRGPGGKYALRRAMEGVLPPAILSRPKTGFGVPLRRWLREDLREYVGDVLSPASLHGRGLFEPRAVDRLLRLDRAGRVDGAFTILALLCVELWCRQFVDGDTPAARLAEPMRA
ncbi:MAG TPA: asparagine synthase-related protein, partial [Longimicrobiales bacterium]